MTDREFRECAQCHKQTFPGPMLREEVWLQFAGPKDYLCLDCITARAEDCGIKIGLASLMPALFNLVGKSRSWFMYFLRRETLGDDDASPFTPEQAQEWMPALVYAMVSEPSDLRDDQLPPE